MERRNSPNFLNPRYRSCSVLLTALIVAGFSLVVVKAFQLQVVEHAEWLEKAKGQQAATLKVPAYRGSIYDRQGRLLSSSVLQHSLEAEIAQIENPRKVAHRLASILEEPQGALEKKLVSERRCVLLKRHLTDQQAAAVERLNVKGLNLTRESKRFYPYRQVAGQVLGFVNVDGTGLEGIEKSFDRVLTQKATAVEQVRDGYNKFLWLDKSMPPEPSEGLGVRLTIDTFLQYLCEHELEKVALHYKAKAAEAVILDPRTFEVLAMANWPFFDPNLEDRKDPDAWRNRVITDSFEPGSTFKVFLVSAALEERVIRDRDRVFCENGKCKLAGHMVNDTHPYGWLTIPEAIKYSSNIAAGKLALQLGNERYYRYIRSFGFGSQTGIQLPGEVKGLVRPCKRWRPIDLTAIGFGQGIGVTALQLTAAVASIANGGEYRQPMIAKEVVEAQDQSCTLLEPAPFRRVIQKKTAQQVRAMMQGVTQDGGTGVSAVPEGYTAAGKTGTAQLIDPVTRRYAAKRYTSLFTGFIPAEQPRLVITIVVHEPQGAIYGGVVAAPVFRDIAAKALPYLGVFPSQKIPPPSAPGLRSAGVAEKPRKASVIAASPKKSSTSKGKAAKSAPQQGSPKNNTVPMLSGNPPEAPKGNRGSVEVYSLKAEHHHQTTSVD